MNKRTVCLTEEQYNNIITTMREGTEYNNIKILPNNKVATALVTEANLGIRISDILNLTMKSFVRDGNKDDGSPRYRLDIIEQKTQKKRTFTVNNELYNFLRDYADEENMRPSDRLFPLTPRAIQIHLQKICSALGYDASISTHSFRKYFATGVYQKNGHDIRLVQTLLQHSSTAITEKYIGISQEQIENAIESQLNLI